MWELRERGEVLSVQTRAKPAEAARAGFAEGAIAAELAVLHRRSFELRALEVRCQLRAFSRADAGADLAGTFNCSRSLRSYNYYASGASFSPHRKSCCFRGLFLINWKNWG